MRTLGLVLVGLLAYTPSAFSQQTVEISVTDYDGLRREINRANGRPPGTLTVIDIPIGLPLHTEEDLLRIESNIHIRGGRFLESLLDGTTAQLFAISADASLRVERSEFVDWSHVGVGPQAFWNQGELILKDVVISSIYGSAHVFGLGGCIPHLGAVIFNGETGNLTMDGVRISDSGGRNYPCGAEPGNGFLRNEGEAEIRDTQFFLEDNGWDWPIYNSGVLIVRDSEFVVDNEGEDPSLSLVFATETARTEFINTNVQGFRQDLYGLSNGGANGLYFDPTNNGHYVYVLDNNSNTLVVWNTFDVNRRQAWVLAIGTLVNGRSMTADAYINESGKLTENGPIGANLDRYWGTIQLDLTSCEGGTFSFSSELPNFTSGEFYIRRLAFVKQLGCEE